MRRKKIKFTTVQVKQAVFWDVPQTGQLPVSPYIRIGKSGPCWSLGVLFAGESVPESVRKIQWKGRARVWDMHHVGDFASSVQVEKYVLQLPSHLRNSNLFSNTNRNLRNFNLQGLSMGQTGTCGLTTNRKLNLKRTNRNIFLTVLTANRALNL